MNFYSRRCYYIFYAIVFTIIDGYFTVALPVAFEIINFLGLMDIIPSSNLNITKGDGFTLFL
jgi:hypothetical protein